MTAVLITGATGFIGAHTARAFVARGDAVRCLVRPTSDRSSLSDVELCFGDLEDRASLERAVDGVGVVVHLASLLKVPWKPAFERINVGGTEALFAAVAGASVPPAVVLVSSLAAAGPAPHPRVETETPAPISRYGRVKLATETAARAHADRVSVTIVRPPMVFGEGDRYGFQLFRTTARGVHLVPTLRAHRISLIHVEDLASVLLAAAERGERISGGGGCGGGVYYAAADETPTYAELGRMVGRACGTRTRVLSIPSPLSAVAAAISELSARVRDRPTILNLDKWREATGGSWTCDASKAKRELGFTPRPLEQRLAQTAEWYRAQGWLDERV